MYPFRYIMDSIRSWFKRRLSRNFRLEIDTLQTIQILAEREQMTPEEVADSILIHAFQNQQAQEENRRRWRTLTPREKDITGLICLNYTTRGIAEKLHIAQPTVKTHVAHILAKFDVPDRNTLKLMLSEWDFREWENF